MYFEYEPENKKQYWRRVRGYVIDGYGGKCVCCSESIYEFLSIDYINNNGNLERKTMSPHKLIYYLDHNNFPDGYQLLCYNCNLAKSNYGICPHKTSVKYDPILKTHKKVWYETRLKILNAYGHKCICCSEIRYEFLAIDHVLGGGVKEHKSIGYWKFMNQIINNNYPDKYQLLCHNCNMSKGFHGVCPHTKINF